MSAWPLGVGALVDWLVGDPPRPTHPVILIGRAITSLEKLLLGSGTPFGQRVRGVILTLLVVGGTLALSGAGLLLAARFHLALMLGLWWLSAALAARSLFDHALVVERRLHAGDLPGARQAVGYIVGRDTIHLTAEEVVRAAIESVAENTGDGVLAPLFYAALGAAFPPLGLPPAAGAAIFALAYKAVNTLDSTVGYRSERYQNFGWASARLDDLANFVPARLSALVVVIAAPFAGGSARRSLRTLLRDGRKHPSPNSGLLEAVYAGALGVRLGGPSSYGGVPGDKELIGDALHPLGWEAIKASRRLLVWASAFGVVLAMISLWAVGA